MKKILWILLVIVSFTACKKNNDDIAVAPASKNDRIKKVTAGATTINYSYDDKTRLVKQAFSDGTKIEYEYLAGIVKQKIYSNTSMLLSTFIMEVNADGMQTRITLANDPVYEQLCVYNADKTLSKKTSKLDANNTQIEEFFYTNGNIDSITTTQNGVLIGTSILSYYTGKLNVLNYEAHGYGLLFGKDSKDILKSEAYRSQNGVLGDPEDFSYEYDGQGKVTKQVNTGGGNTAVSFYEYY